MKKGGQTQPLAAGGDVVAFAAAGQFFDGRAGQAMKGYVHV